MIKIKIFIEKNRIGFFINNQNYINIYTYTDCVKESIFFIYLCIVKYI